MNSPRKDVLGFGVRPIGLQCPSHTLSSLQMPKTSVSYGFDAGGLSNYLLSLGFCSEDRPI